MKKGSLVFLVVALVAILVCGSLLTSCEGEGEGEGEEATATFIADFMDVEGEPYPFDVIISDGTFREEYNGVTSINTEVPLDATYHFRYGWDTIEGVHYSVLRTILQLEPGETAEFEVLAHDPDSIDQVTQYVVGYREKGANEIVECVWDEDTMTLAVSVSAEPGKTVGMYGITNKQHESLCALTTSPLVAPWLVAWMVVKVIEILTPVEVDTCKCTSYYENGNAKDDHSHTNVQVGSAGIVNIEIGFQGFDPSDKSGLGMYGAFYNDAFVGDVSTSLYSMESENTTQPQYYYPQYAVLPGHYLLQFSTPPEFPDFDLPILLEACEIVIAKAYLPKISELEAYSFSVLAEEPGAESSYSNLVHDTETGAITVDVDTGFPDDWWGYFVLPDTEEVGHVTAYVGEVPYELSESYNYTVTEAGDFNLVAVRVSPEVDQLTLCIAGPPEIDSLVEMLRYCQTHMSAPDPMNIYSIYTDDEIGLGYRDDFAAAVVAGNYSGHFNIVGQQSVAPEATDVTTELTAALASGADALCAFVHGSVSTALAIQADALGVDFDAMVVALGASSDSFWTNTAGAAEGIIGFGDGCGRWMIGQWQSGTWEIIAPFGEATASPVYPMP